MLFFLLFDNLRRAFFDFFFDADSPVSSFFPDFFAAAFSRLSSTIPGSPEAVLLSIVIAGKINAYVVTKTAITARTIIALRIRRARPRFLSISLI